MLWFSRWRTKIPDKPTFLSSFLVFLHFTQLRIYDDQKHGLNNISGYFVWIIELREPKKTKDNRFRSFSSQCILYFIFFPRFQIRFFILFVLFCQTICTEIILCLTMLYLIKHLKRKVIAVIIAGNSNKIMKTKRNQN